MKLRLRWIVEASFTIAVLTISETSGEPAHLHDRKWW